MKSRITFVAAMLFAWPGTAHAADFTFEVPLRLENLVLVNQARVTCQVSRVGEGEAGRWGSSNLLGRGVTTVPVTGGGYDGTVIVEVNATSLRGPTEARSYICSLDLRGPSRSGPSFTTGGAAFAETYATATGHSLVRHTDTASANLP